ncbi:MAG: hypothetical protein M1823_001138 [Watsoniomyces obsoletus]|nr:MAG: hypothetical protein M1823_001138 [Watsoniomyces obsoletus]
MRGKRSKQYRKLMQQYELTFGFREPYQVLSYAVDADIIKDAGRFKMDLIRNLEKALHGKIKPMITQCSMRHLYSTQPPVPELIEQAKTYERRRCDHHTLEEPLSTLECLSSVVDAKGNRVNKHRYIVATQSPEVRAFLRTIPGVPLIYIHRSVTIMEPMASVTEDVRDRDERRKFRSTLRDKTASGSLKRKRVDEVEGRSAEDALGGVPSAEKVEDRETGQGKGNEPPKKKRRRGPKGPNPLSVKPPKKRNVEETKNQAKKETDLVKPIAINAELTDGANENNLNETSVKKKRRRKHKTRQADEGNNEQSNGPVDVAVAVQD